MGRERKSGQCKHPHYAGYIKNLRLDSKCKANPCKTFTQECDTIKLCSSKEKRNHLAAVWRMDVRRTQLAVETIWSGRVVRQDRTVALTQENRRKEIVASFTKTRKTGVKQIL